jgi:ataxia telangiectasia mutated family protein
MQTGFEQVFPILKDILRLLVNHTPPGFLGLEGQDLDFAPMQLGSTAPTSVDKGLQELSPGDRHSLHVTLAFLGIVPAMQSNTVEPTRDKDVSELFLGCSETRFAVVADVYFQNVRRHTHGLGPQDIAQLLEKLEGMLTAHTFARSERVQLIAVDCVEALMPLCLASSVAHSRQGAQTRALCHWLAQALGGSKIRSWRMRDRIAQFFDKYLEVDPAQRFWMIVDHTNDDDEQPTLDHDLFPSTILPKLGKDEDIRVRFRAAGINARLLLMAHSMGEDQMTWYHDIRQWFSSEVDR